MAITNSVRQILAGLGTASIRGSTVTATTITANAVTAALSNLSPAMNCGMWRLKVSGVDAGHAIANYSVTATDGTTTIYLVPIQTITGGVNGQGMDVADEWQSDLNLKTFTAVVTGAAGVTTLTVDFEVWGQANAGGA